MTVRREVGGLVFVLVFPSLLLLLFLLDLCVYLELVDGRRVLIWAVCLCLFLSEESNYHVDFLQEELSLLLEEGFLSCAWLRIRA